MNLSSKTGQRHTSGKQALVEKQTRQKLTSNKPCDYCSYKHVEGKCPAFGKFCKGCAKGDISIKPRNANWLRMMLIKLS